MTTRAMIMITENKNMQDIEEEIEDTDIFLYVHADGYPEALGEEIKEFLTYEGAKNLMGDKEYMYAWLLKKIMDDYVKSMIDFDKENSLYGLDEDNPLPTMKNFNGYGISSEMHGDISYLYVIDMASECLHVYENYGGWEVIEIHPINRKI